MDAPSSNPVKILDDDGLDPLAGQTTLLGSAGCVGHPESVDLPNSCNARFCYTSDTASSAGIWLDLSQVTAYSSGQGVSMNRAVQTILVHEIGHVLNLDDVSGSFTCNGSNPTVMNSGGASACGLYLPQTCDVTGFNNTYSGWTVFSGNMEKCGCNVGVNC